MRKIWGGILIIVMAITLVACGSDKGENKYIIEGKIAIVNEEYDKAIKLIRLGIESEKKENAEYLELLKIAEGFLKLKNINESLEFKEFEDILKEVEELKLIGVYKTEFDKLVEKIKENKNDYEKIKEDLKFIDKMKKEGELDKSKSRANSALKKIEKNEKLKEIINKKIEEIEKIIKDVGEKIKKIDKLEGIDYIDVRGTEKNGYDRLEKLKGKRMLHFMEVGYESPRDYMYDLKTGDIYNFNQGDIFHVNTRKKIFDGMKYEREKNRKENVKITEQEALELCINRYIKNKPGQNKEDFKGYSGASLDEEENEYLVVLSMLNASSGYAGRPLAEYYVDAKTGAIKVLNE